MAVPKGQTVEQYIRPYTRVTSAQNTRHTAAPDSSAASICMRTNTLS